VTHGAATFSPDHSSARRRFQQAASRLDWHLESCSIGLIGPDGHELAFDVASTPGGDPEKVLVVSSGIHGVEGFFGSAVQIALLEHWASMTPPSVRCVFLHGLNPFGFAWLRRFDENNVDPNRNFLLPGERFEGRESGPSLGHPERSVHNQGQKVADRVVLSCVQRMAFAGH